MSEPITNKKPTPDEEAAAPFILAALCKLAGDDEPNVADYATAWEALEEYVTDGETSLLFMNDKIIAYSIWTYEGSFFGVVDQTTEAHILTSTPESCRIDATECLIIHPPYNGE